MTGEAELSTSNSDSCRKTRQESKGMLLRLGNTQGSWTRESKVITGKVMSRYSVKHPDCGQSFNDTGTVKVQNQST